MFPHKLSSSLSNSACSQAGHLPDDLDILTTIGNLGRGMSQYQTQLERVATRFSTVPGRFSEANVTRLGSLNHFETFEDTIDGRKRLSLSGSIVVLDIDLKNRYVESVSVSLASMNTENCPLYLQPSHDPNGCILSSLKQPRLDQFMHILEFLSRCDRYSTKDVDCFHALDLVGKAVSIKAKSDPSFGEVVVNPDIMGIALKYHKRKLAFIDIMAGNDREFAILQSEWLDTNEQWITQEPCKHDVRAVLVLRLDPPVVIPEVLAREWKAVCSPCDSILKNRRVRSSFTVPRHPKFCKVESSDTFDASVVNLLPCDFVTVSEVPLSHPRHIPEMLNRLRQYSHLEELVSGMDRGDPIFHPNDMDISIADVAEFKNKPMPTQLLAVDVSCKADGETVEVSMAIPDAKTTLKINFPNASSEFKVDIDGAVNLSDLHKIVDSGNLPLAASYIVGYLGVKHHRLSVSLT